MFGLFDLCERAAGFHHADNKEKHKQRKSDSLYCAVNIYDYIPNCAALELLWGLGNELPYFRQLFVPSPQSILQVLHNPIIRHSTTSLDNWITGVNPQSGSAPVILSCVSFSARNEGKDFFRKGNHNAACEGQKSICSLGRVVGFQRQTNLYHAETEQNHTYGTD